MRKERWVISGDWHIPVHDPRLVDLVIDIAQDIGCTHFLINGDYLDMYGINFFGPKHPDVIETLEDEFYQGLEYVKTLRKKLPEQKIHISFGNHCQRLERFILKNCRPFWNILTTEKMLQLDDYGITYTPYQEVVQIPGVPIYIVHSPPSYSKHAAAVSLENKGAGNWIFSCTHRMTMAYKPTALGDLLEAHTMGWLGATDLTASHSQIFSYTKGHQTWSNSFIIVDVLGDDFFIQHIPIRNYKAIVDGYCYEG